jgi:hypothetical protein
MKTQQLALGNNALVISNSLLDPPAIEAKLPVTCIVELCFQPLAQELNEYLVLMLTTRPPLPYLSCSLLISI